MNASVARLSAWLLVVGLLAIVAGLRWPGPDDWLKTDVRALLPEPPAASAWTQVALQRLAQPTEARTVWLVAHGERDGAVEAARQLGKRLQASGVFTEVQVEADDERLQRMSRALRPYRDGLLTRSDAQHLQREPKRFLKQRIADQFGLIGAARGAKPSDPYGLFQRFIRAAMESSAGAPRQLHRGVAVLAGADAFYAVVEAHPQTAAFQAQPNPPLLKTWRETSQWAEARGVEVLATGAPLFSAHAAADAHRDVTLIGGLSLLAIIALVLARFRSPLPLLATLVVVTTGLAFGFATTIALFQRMHLITLVFSATVIGVSVDYAFHYLCDSLHAEWTPEAGLRNVGPSLTLALASSVVAFLSLALAPFPALREVAVFLAGGLIGAWSAVVVLLPLFVRTCHKAPPVRTTPRWKRPPPQLVGATIFILCLPGIALLEPDDDVRQLYATPERLKADDDRIGELLARPDANRFFLVTGDSVQQVLRRQESLSAELGGLMEAGRIREHYTVTSMIPSIERQRRNETLLAKAVAEGVYGDYLRRLGLPTEQIARREQRIKEPGPYAKPDGVIEELDPIRRALWLGCRTSSCAGVVAIAGAGQGEARSPLGEIAANREGIEWINRVRSINDAMQAHRHLSTALIITALAVVAVALAPAIGVRDAARVVAVPALAVLISLSAIGYTGALFNVFNVMALVLVLGVGIDYALFYNRARAEGQQTAGLAITMAVATTLLAFGLLVLSSNPVVRAFGATLVPGLAAAYLLALTLARPHEPLAP